MKLTCFVLKWAFISHSQNLHGTRENKFAAFLISFYFFYFFFIAKDFNFIFNILLLFLYVFEKKKKKKKKKKCPV